MEVSPIGNSAEGTTGYITQHERHERAAQLIAEAGQLFEDGNTAEAVNKRQEADALVPYPSEEGCF